MSRRPSNLRRLEAPPPMRLGPPPAIATVDELKAYLNITRDTEDAALQAMLDGVAQRVETYTGRRFRPDPQFDDNGDDTLPPVQRTVVLPARRRRFGSQWWEWGFDRSRSFELDIPDARAITSLTASGATISAFEPLGIPPYRRVELFGLQLTFEASPTALPQVTITGRFGIWPPPADLKDAVLFMAARRWKEKDASYGDTVQYPEGMVVSYFRQFPPTVQATLEQYRRQLRLA